MNKLFGYFFLLLGSGVLTAACSGVHQDLLPVYVIIAVVTFLPSFICFQGKGWNILLGGLTSFGLAIVIGMLFFNMAIVWPMVLWMIFGNWTVFVYIGSNRLRDSYEEEPGPSLEYIRDELPEMAQTREKNKFK